MCRIFAAQDPESYRQINRSIRIGGRSTSIQLEAAFWDILDEIAKSQGCSTPKFISKLYDEAIEINGEIPNFASMLRTTCALYLRGHRPAANDARLGYGQRRSIKTEGSPQTGALMPGRMT
jgi:predicted DNA-binding ribbon-helix-helix protein